ncbi:MAG: Asp23/Gls24 family envelope stress response protein [Gemmatimonadaceae bacterium]
MVVESVTPNQRVDMPVRASVQSPERGNEAGNELGNTSIADAVVSKIAGIAAREVDGVHRLVTTGAMATFSGLAQRLTRADQRDYGVAVEVGHKEAAVDLAIEVEYGVEIRRVCDNVRRNVVARIQSMTGLRVKEVNILVADLYFADEDPAPNRRVE